MPADSTNKSQFINLFLKAEPRVYAYIRSQIPHRADAEDVLQETALTLWAKFENFQPGSDFLAWAYQVARFKIQHHLEKQSRRRRLFSQAFIELVADRTEQLADHFGDLEALLVECMEKLPAADREVVQLSYSSDSTLEAVARQLGRPLNTIKSVLKRARRALYECIQRALGMEKQR